MEGNGSFEILAHMLIDRMRKELARTLLDETKSDLEKALAEVGLVRSIINDKSFIISKKAFEKEENAFLIRDYFRLVLAGLETFEKENFGEEK